MSDNKSTDESEIPKNEVKRDELLRLLDAEISHIRAEQTRGGWSLWGVLAALCGSQWALFEVANGKTVHWTNVGQVALGLTLAVDLLLMILTSLGATKKRRAARRRYQFVSGLNDKRPVCLYSAIRCSILALLTLKLSSGVGLIPEMIVIGFYTVIGIVAVFTLYITYLTIPVDREPKTDPKLQGIATAAFSGVLLWPIIAYLKSGLFVSGSVSPPDAQAGGLIVTGIFLLQMAAYVIPKAPLLESLLQVRRDLVLQNIDGAVAIRKLDVILFGLNTEDVAQERLADLLEHIQDLESQQKEVKESLDLVALDLELANNAIVGKAPGEQIEELVDEADLDLDDLKSKISDLKKLRNTASQDLVRFRKQLLGLEQSEAIPKEVPTVLGQIEATLEKLDKTAAILDAGYVALEQAVKAQMKAIEHAG